MIILINNYLLNGKYFIEEWNERKRKRKTVYVGGKKDEKTHTMEIINKCSY